MKENMVVVTTLPVNNTASHLPIVLELTSTDRINTNRTFEYRNNPNFVDIRPRNHLTVYVWLTNDVIKSFCQTANWSVQPFLHSSRQMSLYYTMGALSLKIVPSHGWIWTPCNLWFLALLCAHNPKGITIGSAVFAQMSDRRVSLVNLLSEIIMVGDGRFAPGDIDDVIFSVREQRLHA